MHAWADVAYLAKTKGFDGRFVARAATGLPFLLEVGDDVAFVPPQLDVPRTARVADVRPLDDSSAEILFEGVDGEAAQVLAGSHCLVPHSRLGEEVYEDAPATWEGWAVVDEHGGDIGRVVGLVDNPGQALLEVQRPGGKTVLVPVVDAIVKDVDPDARIVRVDLPSGLLDL